MHVPYVQGVTMLKYPRRAGNGEGCNKAEKQRMRKVTESYCPGKNILYV
jgi:hypothetical protein